MYLEKHIYSLGYPPLNIKNNWGSGRVRVGVRFWSLTVCNRALMHPPWHSCSRAKPCISHAENKGLTCPAIQLLDEAQEYGGKFFSRVEHCLELMPPRAIEKGYGSDATYQQGRSQDIIFWGASSGQSFIWGGTWLSKTKMLKLTHCITQSSSFQTVSSG